MAKVFTFLETAIDRMIEADTLVVEQQQQPGFPDFLCIVRGMMPIFVWVKPKDIENDTWQAAKLTVESNVLAAGCAAWDLQDADDLTRLHDMVVGVIRAKTKALPTAADEGFDPADQLVKEVLTPTKTKRAWLD
jgi:hypothetical protein